MQYQFDIDLATQFGVDEAVFVHNVYMLVRANAANNRNERDGKFWTYNSVAALQKIFPFWTSRQIERVIRSCREKGLIETAKLSANARDRTTWFTITETVECIYANGELHFTKRGNGFPQTVECTFHETVECIKGTNKNQVKTQVIEHTHMYGEFENVRLTDSQLDKLNTRFPPEQVQQEIEALSGYMRSKGKRYADHYATLLNWLRRDFPPQESKPKLIEESWCQDV